MGGGCGGRVGGGSDGGGWGGSGSSGGNTGGVGGGHAHRPNANALQSSQSEPKAQLLYWEPAPPSSQMPSCAYSGCPTHSFEQIHSGGRGGGRSQDMLRRAPVRRQPNEPVPSSKTERLLHARRGACSLKCTRGHCIAVWDNAGGLAECNSRRSSSHVRQLSLLVLLDGLAHGVGVFGFGRAQRHRQEHVLDPRPVRALRNALLSHPHNALPVALTGKMYYPCGDFLSAVRPQSPPSVPHARISLRARPLTLRVCQGM